jgi:hypothetical protein
MPARRRTGLWVAGVVGVAAVAGVSAYVATTANRGKAPMPVPAAATAATSKATTIDAATPLPDLVGALRTGDSHALAELFRRTAVQPDTRPTALNEAETTQWADVFAALRTNFLRFNAPGRASTMMIVGRTLQRLAVEPAPTTWSSLLQPAHDLLDAGLNESGLEVRVTALDEVSRLWSWVPARTLTGTQEDALAGWKQGFQTPVVRRLGDREPEARIAAVKCLGELPVATAAAPAIAFLDDPRSADVRKQVLVSFARRRSLLSEDDVLRRLAGDSDPGVAQVAEIVLKTRGLTKEQISLGSMIFHRKPEIRASVIPLLKDRADIDPTVWLLQLSHDLEESVRLGSIDALAARMTPEIGQRLAEMAATDQSPAVRKSAGRFLAESEKTAALPPLPGSSSLNPKAN